MRPSRLSACTILIVAALSACAGTTTAGDVQPGTERPANLAGATVTRVVDGDTIHVLLEGRDTTVRLIGIDTPEKDGPYTHEECFGREASAYTERSLDGAEVGLEFDVDRQDRYGRTLAYVWTDAVLFSEQILRDGYAVLLTVPPNVRYVDRLAAAQADAHDDGAGLWGACPA
jgi:micrococcal nuclease